MSIFKRNFNKEDDDDERDYFDGPDLPDPEVKVKQPKLKPDSPKYWDQPESEYEHLKPRSFRMSWVWVGGAIALLALIVALWLRYFVPCVDQATMVGYVESIEMDGKLMHTYEGVLLPYKDINDTSKPYERDFIFSAKNLEIAKQLIHFEKEHIPVRVEYKEYSATVPWRGCAKKVVVAVDSVDIHKILIPAFDAAPLPDRYLSTTEK